MFVSHRQVPEYSKRSSGNVWCSASICSSDTPRLQAYDKVLLVGKCIEQHFAHFQTRTFVACTSTWDMDVSMRINSLLYSLEHSSVYPSNKIDPLNWKCYEIISPISVFPSRCHSEHVKHLCLWLCVRVCVCACTERNAIDDDFVGSMSKARCIADWSPPLLPHESFGVIHVGGAAVFRFLFCFWFVRSSSSVWCMIKATPSAALRSHSWLSRYHKPHYTTVFRVWKTMNWQNRSVRRGTQTHTHARSLGRIGTDGRHTHKPSNFFLLVCVWVSVWAEIARAVCAHCCKTQNIHTAVAE